MPYVGGGTPSENRYKKSFKRNGKLYYRGESGKAIPLKPEGYYTYLYDVLNNGRQYINNTGNERNQGMYQRVKRTDGTYGHRYGTAGIVWLKKKAGSGS